MQSARWIAAALALIASSLAVAVPIFSGLFDVRESPRELSTRRSPAPATVVERRLDQAMRDLRQLKAEVRARGGVSTPSKVGARLGRTERQVRLLSADLAELRDAIAPDPAKALQVTLLQRDLRSAENRATAETQSLRADIDRQYDLMKFVVGTLGLGVIGLIATLMVPTLRRFGPGGDAEGGASRPRRS